MCPRPESGEGAAVRNTKTNSYEDTVAFDEACDILAGHGWVGQLLKDLRLSLAGPSLFLFALPLGDYERLFAEAVTALMMGALRIAPHSCRHGGPSEDAAASLRTAIEIQKRGRWESPKSVNRYMKPGTLLRQLNKLPASLVPAHKLLLATLPAVWTPRPSLKRRRL